MFGEIESLIKSWEVFLVKCSQVEIIQEKKVTKAV